MTPEIEPQRETRAAPRHRALLIALGCVLWLGVVGGLFAIKFREFTRVRETEWRTPPQNRPSLPPAPRPQFPQLPTPASRPVPKSPTPAELETKARAGDAASALRLAQLLEQQTPAQLKVAFEWRLRAAETGDGMAMAGVARAYRQGIGVERDAALAERWTERAVAAGGAELWDRIGTAFRLGVNYLPRDVVESVPWHRRAAEKGLPSAQANYALVILQGRVVAKDVVFARSLLESAVQAGNTAAMLTLAGTLTQDAPTDLPRARGLYRDAAKKKWTTALIRHGLFCQNGIGGPRDLATARQEFKAAADLGNVAALLHLAEALLASDVDAGLASEPEEARRLLEQAAAKNDFAAKTALAKVERGTSLAVALGFGPGEKTPVTTDALRLSFDLARLDQVPRPVAQARPQYPASLRLLGIGGEVVVDFLVDQEGHVQNAYAIRSTAAGFEGAAVEAVSAWRFEAGRKNGAAVVTHMQVPIVFTMNETAATASAASPARKSP